MQFSDLINFSLGTIPVSIASAVGAVWAWSKLIAEKRLDHEFNKRLEKHKSELQSLRDHNNFDLGRRLSDFNLYSTKKHEVYRDVYSQINYAINIIMDLKNHGRKELIKTFSLSKIKQLLEHFQVPNELIQTFRAGSDEEESVEIVLQWLFSSARKQITTSRDKFLGNSLYLSENVELNCMEIVNAMHNFVDIFETVKTKDLEHSHYIELTSEMRNHQDNSVQLLMDLKEQMRKELKQGYYDDSATAL